MDPGNPGNLFNTLNNVNSGISGPTDSHVSYSASKVTRKIRILDLIFNLDISQKMLDPKSISDLTDLGS